MHQTLHANRDDLTVGDRTPPNSLDAERAVLGAVLLRNDTYAQAAARVDSGDFYRDAHRRIFDAIVELNERGAAIDLITLKEALTRTGEIDDVGGVAYLARLVDGVPRATNVEHYAGIVRDLSRRRAIIAHASVVLEAAAQCDDDVLDSRLAGFDEVVRRKAATDAHEILTLRERLARPRRARLDRIAGWQPQGARVMLAAQFKAGKTTLVGNLVRSLVDGDPFLGTADVAPLAGTVAILDTEMADGQLDDWLRAQGIRRDDAVIPIPLRGAVGGFDILKPAVRRRWAHRLRALGAEYVILDCLRPVLDVLALDEHRDAGRFLVAFDALLDEAGVGEALVVHHMGHQGERSRGDSRLRDWPDVEWRLVRQGEAPGSPRFISAYGRDVEAAEAALTYDAATRRLTLACGSRRDAKLEDALAAIGEVIDAAAAPPSGRAIKRALADLHAKQVVDDALHYGLTTGRLASDPGLKRSKRYRRVPVSQCVPAVSQRDRGEGVPCPDS